MKLRLNDFHIHTSSSIGWTSPGHVKVRDCQGLSLLCVGTWRDLDIDLKLLLHLVWPWIRLTFTLTFFSIRSDMTLNQVTLIEVVSQCKYSWCDLINLIVYIGGAPLLWSSFVAFSNGFRGKWAKQWVGVPTCEILAPSLNLKLRTFVFYRITDLYTRSRGRERSTFTEVCIASMLVRSTWCRHDLNSILPTLRTHRFRH